MRHVQQKNVCTKHIINCKGRIIIVNITFNKEFKKRKLMSFSMLRHSKKPRVYRLNQQTKILFRLPLYHFLTGGDCDVKHDGEVGFFKHL